MSRAGSIIVGGITIVSRDRIPYAIAEAWYSGLSGLAITRVVEYPNIWTTTHILSGLRIGASRFPDVKTACESACRCLHLIDFTKKGYELVKDINFALCLEVFMKECYQVKPERELTRIDLGEFIDNNGIDQAKKIIQQSLRNPRNPRR